jgi:hypothetical protein
MNWTYDDGGAAAAGFTPALDCVVRSISIVTQIGYLNTLELVRDITKQIRTPGLQNDPRRGVSPQVLARCLKDLGFVKTPTMGIGTGTTVHLRRGELPSGRLLARISYHLTAVVDGVVRDTHDPTREGTRAVYAYWRKP